MASIRITTEATRMVVMNKRSGIHRRLALNPTPAFVQRFWSRVDMQDSGDCWEWKAGFRNGYGAIKHGGRVHSAHRVAFVLSSGEPQEGLVIAHKCDNRKCCNPSHLEAVTPSQNNRDARGRLIISLVRGEMAPWAVMSESEVREVIRLRRECGYGARRIASQIGRNANTVKSILDGRSWKQITGGPVQRGAGAGTRNSHG